MKLESLEISQLDIPLRIAFRHASADRDRTETVWVEARSANAIGYGEGCPRPYVTGETIDSAIRFFNRHASALCQSVRELDDVVEWSTANREDIDRNPAAWCAIELALLDTLAKESGRSVDALLGLPELRGTFRYTAVIGVVNAEKFSTFAAAYTTMGFTDFKLKASSESGRDRENLRHLRALVPDARVRLDANNLWRSTAEAAEYLRALDHLPFAVEEPLAPLQYEALAQLSADVGIPVILDESCVHAEELSALDGLGERWIVNLRVSKMGGLLRSLATLKSARQRGIPVIVGAQVGETSLLTRAALTVAQRACEQLVAQEGAFGTLLLSEDVCDPPLMFGPGGELQWHSNGHGGFGISVASGFARQLRLAGRGVTTLQRRVSL